MLGSSIAAPPPPAGAGGGATSVAAALTGLDNFEAALKNGTRARREKDEARVNDLRLSIRDVETRLSDEADRHVESIRALQSWAETQVAGVRARAEAALKSSAAATSARLDALNARVDALAAKFEADRAATLETVEARNRELVAALQAFAAAFELEKAARAAREAALAERLGVAEHEARATWDEERSIREGIYMAAKARIEEAVRVREKGDAKFQASMVAEIAAVKTGLAAEAAVRAVEDDHASAALAAYVAKLQASLALVNTEDARF